MPDLAGGYGGAAATGGKARLRRAAWHTLHAAGILALQRLVRRAAGKGTAAVIVFHRVTPDVPEDGITVHPQRFRDICAMLKESYRVIRAGELVRRLAAREPLTGREVVITFDDGYLDNHAYAAPILQAYGLPAIFFLTAGYVGTDRTFPWDAQKGHAGPLMSWQQAAELSALGFELGCHTWSHPDLGTAPVSDAPVELHQARATIGDRTGHDVRHFAYPFGGRANITPAWVEAVKAEGFDSLFCGYGGLACSRDVPHWIPRTGASHQRTLADLRIEMDEPW